MRILNVDHARKGKGGHIIRERGYCTAMDKPISDMLVDLESELEAILEEGYDEMLLLSLGEMTEEEYKVLPEFWGW